MIFPLVMYRCENWTIKMAVVAHSLTCVSLTPWTSAHQDSMSFTISWNLLKLMSIELMMPPNHLILNHSLLLLPPTFPSIEDFQWVSPLHQTANILLSKGLSRVFSSCTVLKHQFFGAQPSLAYSKKRCLCFLLHYLDWSKLFFQGVSTF